MYYWNIQAQNTQTKQTVKQQDLTGAREQDHDVAMQLAQTFADKLTARSRQTWVPKVVWCASTDS